MLAGDALDEGNFFLLSVLCIRDDLTLDELNSFVSYTGIEATAETMAQLEERRFVACERRGRQNRYVLTADGREVALRQIALAKAQEDVHRHEQVSGR